MQIEPSRLAISSLLGDVEVQVDPSQLRQILWNLCENAIKYGSGEPARGPSSCVSAGWPPRPAPSWKWPIAAPALRRSIASAFSSPSSPATSAAPGLGLFLARELAQTNGATLLYEPRTSGGSLFRIVFRDPERWVA